MTKYTLQHIRPAKTPGGRAYVRYLTVKQGVPEFNAPGNTSTGVGVANLKTWKTATGAGKWMNENRAWVDGMAATGEIKVVPV
jgi:hypothetical protein